MSVAVFGPLTLEGVSLSPRERTVLSALVLRAGQPLTTDELADAVWPDRPPGTWLKQLQAIIGHLRVALGRNAIVTTAAGYELHIDPDQVDAERFERLAASARQHLDDDPARAVDAAEQALSLWRGSPYADLSSWPPALIESERLGEVRMELEEIRVDGRLRLGAHAASVADAKRLVREAPLRERRWAMLATALYRCDRQADALAAIRAARERLADELGVEPGSELSELELRILRHDDSLEPDEVTAGPSTACPYRGLQPFGVEDGDIFFGRDGDIDSALARLARTHFLALSGASGSGKSSLVRAGLVPALRRRGDRVVVVMPEHDLDLRIRDAVWGAGRADVLIVDQFEEVFHAGEADVDAAARVIAEAAAHGTTVVIVVRSDFLDDCAAHPGLAPLVAEGVHLVGPMSARALRAVIEEPARGAGLQLESGLVEVILRDAAGEAGALPHLSHALVETWLRREGATLTIAGYEASGGISGAIAQSADRLFQSMDAEERATCRWLLLRLVTLGPDGNPVRRRVPSRPLRADAARERVLAMLARARLVRTETDVVEVAHESFARAWPRLQAWLEEDAEGARILTTVATAAEAWNAAGRPDDDLLRGARLQAVLEWREGAPTDLTEVESAFLDASSEHASAEREQLARRARRDRRQNRRLRGLLGAAGGLIVLLVGAGSVAVVTSNEANAQRDSATLEALVATSLALQRSEPDVAALLAAEAYRRWPGDPRTRSGLMSLLQGVDRFLGTAVVASGGSAFGSAIPGTEDVVVVTTAGDAAIRDAATGEVLRELDLGFEPGPTLPTPLVEVSGDSRIAAVLWSAHTRAGLDPGPSTSTRSTLAVFDLVRAERVGDPIPIDIGTGALAVNADGSIIAVADSRDGAVRLVTTSDREVRGITEEMPVPLPEYPPVSTRTAALAFDRQGQLLVGRFDGQVDVIDTASGTISTRMSVPPLMAHAALAVGASGIVIAAGDVGLIAFDPDAQRVRWSTSLESPSGGCSGLAVSESRGRVYCGRLGRIDVFDLGDGVPIPSERIEAILGDVGTIDVSVDGGILTAVYAKRPIVTRWQLDGIGLGRRLVAPGHQVAGPYSFEGSSIVTVPRDSEFHVELTNDVSGRGGLFRPIVDGVVVVDTATGDLTYRFDEPVSDVGWVRGARLFAWTGEDGWFRLIDVATRQRVGSPIWGVRTLWPSPGGTRLHTVREDGRIRDIDPRTGEADGEAWGVAGRPEWISTAPDGDRIAVTYASDDAPREPDEASTGDQPPIRLAIVDAAQHRILTDTAAPIDAHVMVEGGELLGIEGARMGRYRIDPLVRLGTVPGATGDLDHLSVSRDSRTLLLMADDGSALLYDTTTDTPIGEPFTTDDGPALPIEFFDSVGRPVTVDITDAVIRPDGMEIALSTPQGVVVWDIDPDHQFEFACRVAGRDLNANEWQTYLGRFGEPRSTCGFGSAD